MDRLLGLFGSALKRGARLVLYKGPDVESELADARKHQVHAEVVSRYELPGNMGSRTVIEVRANKKKS
jgi:16S rRNA (guanine527-N7)-methyltransferase